MMMGKMEARPNVPRDGRHCDLCGCSQPAVKCDKCGCQIFCLSCDDMYHRHPKRRFHLRKAVDSTPATHMARPVLPMKLSQLPLNSGDPSKMPLPPPRKKKSGKSFFDSFRKKSPNSESSPPLPKKEYSWTDRLGNIKKFMSNRPLPPLPNGNEEDEGDVQQNAQTEKHDMSFIHKRVYEKPPQLPQRSMKPVGMFGQENGEMRNGTLPPSQRNQNHWDNQRNENFQRNTMHRQQAFGYPSGGPGSPGNLSTNMHHSSSSTDLQTLPVMDGSSHPHAMLPPHYPQYPPHYPYPMYPPQYPNYPPYFASSFANLPGQQQPMMDGEDFSDHSGGSTRNHSNGRRYPFRKRAAKRSQSVMVDRMAYPGQFFPFGPFPPGPWGPAFPMEAPPSPASSIRSLNRIGGRTRRRRKTTSDDEDEDYSMSSSPFSRPKSSSSDRPQVISPQRIVPQMTSSDESEEEVVKERSRSRSRNERILRKDSDPKKPPSPTVKSPIPVHKKPPKQKKREKLRYSDNEELPPSPTKSMPAKSLTNSKTGVSEKEEIWVPSTKWQCTHCTYVNSAGKRICQVCCKTVSAENATIVRSRQNSSSPSSRKQSQSSDISSSSPEKKVVEEDIGNKRDKQDMEVLNSALDEAEKEISRGLEELMKLKQDISPNSLQTSDNQSEDNSSTSKFNSNTTSTNKPIYKSSGKMRPSILDKLTLSSAKPTATASTSTETQNAQTNSKTDRIIEARRASNSSTASEAYNSPTAQSPQLDTKQKKHQENLSNSRKDSSCQTQTGDLMGYLDPEENGFGRPDGFPTHFGDRIDIVTSPVSFLYDRGYGKMHRSHSRASLFTGRMNDFGSTEYGLGPTPMYRSVSRSSLAGEYPDGRFMELRKPDYYLSMEELIERKRQETVRAQGQELVRMIREAERQGFTADDIQVALQNCGNRSPMEWLQENWKKMPEQVIELATKYANNKKENDIGTISEREARDALRMHQGNTWAAVTECVEGRQRKFLELKARGKYSTKNITDALTSSDGDVELAYSKLSKSTSKPFLMRIWGAGEGVQNKDGANSIISAETPKKVDVPKRDKVSIEEAQSDEIWDDEDDDIEWDEDFDEEEEHGDLEDLQTCHEDIYISDEVKTPDSDRSDYCDAFGTNTLERNVSLPSSNTFVAPDIKQSRKGTGFLSKLAALRKDEKSKSRAQSPLYVEQSEVSPVSQSDLKLSAESSEQSKAYNPISVIKNTISAIRESVGSSKSDKKNSCSTPERRTIIVEDQIKHETVFDDSKNVKLKSLKLIEQDCEISLNSTIENTDLKPKQTKSQVKFSESTNLPGAKKLNRDGTSESSVKASTTYTEVQMKNSLPITVDSSNTEEIVLDSQLLSLQIHQNSKSNEASNDKITTSIPGDKIQKIVHSKNSPIVEGHKLDANENVPNIGVFPNLEQKVTEKCPSASGAVSSSPSESKKNNDKQIITTVSPDKSKGLPKSITVINKNKLNSKSNDTTNKNSKISEEQALSKEEYEKEDTVLGNQNQVSKNSKLPLRKKEEISDGEIKMVLPEPNDKDAVSKDQTCTSPRFSNGNITTKIKIADAITTDPSNKEHFLNKKQKQESLIENISEDIVQCPFNPKTTETESNLKKHSIGNSVPIATTEHHKGINSKAHKLKSKENGSDNVTNVVNDSGKSSVEKSIIACKNTQFPSKSVSSSESPVETNQTKNEEENENKDLEGTLDNKIVTSKVIEAQEIKEMLNLPPTSSKQEANSLEVQLPNANDISIYTENSAKNVSSIITSSSEEETIKDIDSSFSSQSKSTEEENEEADARVENISPITTQIAAVATTSEKKSVIGLNSSLTFQTMEPIHSSTFNRKSPVQQFTAIRKDSTMFEESVANSKQLQEQSPKGEIASDNDRTFVPIVNVSSPLLNENKAHIPETVTNSLEIENTVLIESSINIKNIKPHSSMGKNSITLPMNETKNVDIQLATKDSSPTKNLDIVSSSKVIESPLPPIEINKPITAITKISTPTLSSPKDEVEVTPTCNAIFVGTENNSTVPLKLTDGTDSNSTQPHEIEMETNESENTEHQLMATSSEQGTVSDADDSDNSESDVSLESPKFIRKNSAVDTLRSRFEGLIEENSPIGPIRPASPYRRMSFRSRKEAIALERTRDSSTEKPWFIPKTIIEAKKPAPKKTLKQQMEEERKVRKLVADKKCRTYRKAEIVVQLMDMNFSEEEAIQAANECSTFERALSYLQQECLLCTGHFPASHMISMVHCPHMACRECIRAYFTVQIRDRNIMELLCPFCNEPDIFDEDIAQDYFNHLDIMLKKLVDPEIHELFQRKLRDRVLMRDPNFRWCSQCSSGFIAMPNLKRLVCPDCNAVTCASCRRPWEREHQGISCEAFSKWKDSSDPEAQAAGLAKLLTEDGIDCPRCHFRYALAKGGCMHFRCIQCQHDFCSGCSRPFKMGQKCGVSEFCAKLGLHAHHPRNCLFYLRDKDPEDLQRLLDMSSVKYNGDPPDGMEVKSTCQVMEQKETSDGMVDDFCGKEVEKGFAGLCKLHYVEYLGQLVNKNHVDPIQIFENDDLELVLRRANVRLPPRRYRETDAQFREKLVNVIKEELPLDKMDGS